MPYSGDPSSSQLDAVRFWLQDTGNPPLLNDNELRYYLSYATTYTADPLLIAASLCSVVSAKYAGEVSITGDGVTYSGDQLQAKYTQLAVTLRAEWQRLNSNTGAPVAGGVEWTYPDPSVTPPLFAIGMHDNPRGDDALYGFESNDGELNTAFYGAS